MLVPMFRLPNLHPRLRSFRQAYQLGSQDEQKNVLVQLFGSVHLRGEDDLQDLSADFGLQLGQLNDTTTGGAVWYNFLESQHRGTF